MPPATIPAASPPGTSAPAVYDSGDLARLCRCSRRTVDRWAAAGLIPGRIKIGRLVRYYAATVDGWLAAGGPANLEGGDHA